MPRVKRRSLNVAAAVSASLLLALVLFFAGKRFGYAEGNMSVTPLYWFRWRAQSLYRLSAGRVLGVDLELVLAAVFAIVPVLWISRRLRDTALVRHGRCLNCGYDLRATPQRCPECGTERPTNYESAARGRGA